MESGILIKIYELVFRFLVGAMKNLNEVEV